MIGLKWLLSLKDKYNLLYFEVIIVEVFRLRLVVFFGVFYKVFVDIILNGYNIFKEIILIFNLWVMYYD